MGEAQFSAMVLMAVLTITLTVLLPRKVSGDQMLNRSRWMMAGGTALMSIQFLLQYLLKLRMMGVTQAVMVNLLFLFPVPGCSHFLFSICSTKAKYVEASGGMVLSPGLLSSSY